MTRSWCSSCWRSPRRWRSGRFSPPARRRDSDCPGQDCVHSGAVSRAGQSIVCLPARIVVELVGAADGYDLVTG